MRGAPIHGPIRDDSPCIDCKKPTRYSGCHDTCKKMAEWKAKVKSVKKSRKDYLAKYELGWHKK